ncbi:MAG TPA: MlaD family protein [Solirubrobacteraceae bacterium]|nr:MlaD family protein [Solirubrobacteraceae bacterium]
MNPAGSREGGLSVREQIERYRTAFIAVVTMIVIAAAVGGYILAHENLKLPSWVPVLGRSYFSLKADFSTAQALTPGQGQAVTIAGAKIGEVATVDLQNGVAIVTMKITPKYARYLHRDATLLMRPKTGLQDMTIEVNPGTASAGKLRSGEVVPLSQTAPNINFDEFLASLDAETRAYLQELLAGAGEGFKENGKAFAATLKRFDPLAREGQAIASQLELRHANIARSIHNFRLLIEAVGGKDKQLAQLIDASNAVFAVFAKEDQNVQSTLRLLPGALAKTRSGLGKLATAANELGPTLHQLHPFASSLAAANEATRRLSLKTTPIIRDQIRPFAREILPTISALRPDTQNLAEAFPKLAASFSVLNEFFNELAANQTGGQPGFLFYLDWGNHNLNSVVSSADAHGPLGRTLVYLNCKIASLLKSVASVNPNVNLLVGLLNPPERETCQHFGLSSSAARTPTTLKSPTGGILSGLGSAGFAGHAKTASRGGR